MVEVDGGGAGGKGWWRGSVFSVLFLLICFSECPPWLSFNDISSSTYPGFCPPCFYLDNRPSLSISLILQFSLFFLFLHLFVSNFPTSLHVSPNPEFYSVQSPTISLPLPPPFCLPPKSLAFFHSIVPSSSPLPFRASIPPHPNHLNPLNPSNPLPLPPHSQPSLLVAWMCNGLQLSQSALLPI